MTRKIKQLEVDGEGHVPQGPVPHSWRRQWDLQLNEREFQTAGALTLKALADFANDVRGTVSNSLSADLRDDMIVQLLSHITTAFYHQSYCCL